MSAGVDAMGVAVRLTPALVAAMAVLLAPSAQAETADPAQAPADSAQAPQVEPIDPDCDPEEADRADPELVEEPDGICPPGERERPSDRPATGPSPSPDDGPPSGSPPGGAPPSQPSSPGVPQGPDTAPGKDSVPVTKTGGAGSDERPRPGPPPREREQGGAGPRRPVVERGAGAKPERNSAAQPEKPTKAEPERRSTVTRERPGSGRPQRVHRHGRVPLARFPIGTLEALPDPLPPARRLDRGFARRLAHVSERTRVPWELMLAVLRARGHHGAVPATRARLRSLAHRLVGYGARKHPRRAVRRLAERRPAGRRRPFVQRVIALTHYNRAVRLAGLVRGLEATRRRLARRVLDHHRLVIYSGGRDDIRSGFTDVRVLVLLLYLSSRSTDVTVTSLTTGHSFLTASGNVSLHSHGRAVDIAAIGGKSILGNQEPGGLTERTLRKIMLLPKRLQPTELISLFELGGPSFALADHADHIHVGY
jgi:hypothetical protein